MDALPCLDCGTTGGSTPKNQDKPSRPRGLCLRCYERHHYHKTLDQYPHTRRGIYTTVNGTAKPCLRCGKTGGYSRDGKKPARARGLCDTCYQWATNHKTIDQYPLQGNKLPAQPTITTPQHELDRRMVFANYDGINSVRPGYRAALVIREAEQFAAAWLAKQQQEATQ